MYGPYFLALYGVVIVLITIAAVIFRRTLDRTGAMPTPAIPAEVDPFEIAYLRGGENEMARAVIFALMHKGQIDVFGSTGSFMVGRIENPPSANLSHAERSALGWIGSSREPKEVFAGDGLVALLRPVSETYKRRLESQSFLFRESELTTLRIFRFLAVAAVVALGGYKFAAAIMNSQSNFLFLPVFLVVGLILVLKFSKFRRLTKHGAEYLERLEIVFDKLKGVASTSKAADASPSPAFGAIDPVLLAVGVFGGAVLAGSLYDQYNQAFHRANAASSGGCGSSCGTSCGSCSSGGDSGGSSCGGGCGGCGGGD